MLENNASEIYQFKNENIKFSIFYSQLPLVRAYSYERGVELFDDIVSVHISTNGYTGRGECSPLPSFFNKPLKETLKQLERVAEQVCSMGSIGNRDDILSMMKPGPARNAIDSALIDLECKYRKVSVWQLLGFRDVKPVVMYHTLELDSMDTLENRLLDHRFKVQRLKLKLGSTNDDVDRLALVREIMPKSELIVDVNEGWDIDKLATLMPDLARFSVQMIEQPLKAEDDHHLHLFESPIPIFADESFHTISQIESISRLYSGVNIKLDKIGGLTEALKAIALARNNGLGVMVGCLGGTSLSTAAACVAAQRADFVDLDNHLWLQNDRPHSLGGSTGHMALPAADLWG